MVGNPISDFLIRIKNGYLARLKQISIPHSKPKEELANVLVKEGYLESVKTQLDGKKILLVELKYLKKAPAISEIKIVSKPSLRIYVDKRNIPTVLGGRGLVILSTPAGFMSGREAGKKGVGGEVVCKVW